MNWEAIKKKYDNLWIGVALGGILPVIGFFLAKAVKDKQGSYSVKGFWNLLIGHTNYYMEILTFSLLPNMLFFYLLFFQWKMDQTTKGLIFMTIIYLGIIFLLH